MIHSGNAICFLCVKVDALFYTLQYVWSEIMLIKQYLFLVLMKKKKTSANKSVSIDIVWVSIYLD